MSHRIKLFLDENISLKVAEILRSSGFDVEHAFSTGNRGVPDEKIASYAKISNAILVTKDLEFGSLDLYPMGSHFGLLILRLPNEWPSSKIALHLTEFLSKIDNNDLVNSITVLEIGKYRIRRINKK